MKTLKAFTAFAICALFSSLGQAQNIQPNNSPVPLNMKVQNYLKSSGTILYSEDFSDSTLSKWTAVDLTNQGHDWIWSTSAPGGQYSMNVSAINSSTSSNGFLSLPSDFYHTPLSSLQYLDSMKAYITSDPIVITPSSQVELVYQQLERDCCFNLRPEVQLSTDGLNWTALPSTNGRGQNLSSSNPELIVHDVSSIIGNQDTVYLRFVQDGNSHYYWMIDDLVLRTPLATSLEKRDDLASFTFYPNPSNGILYFEGEIEADEIIIRDVNGRLVFQEFWKKNSRSLDISALEDGLYFLQLTGEEEAVHKLIIQH